MSITPRQYTGDDDLRKIQGATASWIASAGFCGYLHVGDITLRLFNGMRHYPPQEIVHLWETVDGSLLAWAIIYPRWNSYEVLVHPLHRGGDFESHLLHWCEQEALAWMWREGRGTNPISVEVCAGDFARSTMLRRQGYKTNKLQDYIGVRGLDEPIPEIALPEGFSVRPVAGVDEAHKLVEAMNATFGWSWTAEEYGKVMQSPAYQNNTSLVVAAPDGRFASFCFVMRDSWNRIGMFEDVGTHPDFQRQGFGRALLCEGMRRMKAQNMDTAFVPYLASLSPASALYASVGFRVRYRLYRFTKRLPRKIEGNK
jgi:mycothiol synthase